MDISSAPIKVNASKKDFPYIQGRASVQGYDPTLADRRARRLCEKKILLNERKEKAAKEEKN